MAAIVVQQSDGTWASVDSDTGAYIGAANPPQGYAPGPDPALGVGRTLAGSYYPQPDPTVQMMRGIEDPATREAYTAQYMRQQGFTPPPSLSYEAYTQAQELAAKEQAKVAVTGGVLGAVDLGLSALTLRKPGEQKELERLASQGKLGLSSKEREAASMEGQTQAASLARAERQQTEARLASMGTVTPSQQKLLGKYEDEKSQAAAVATGLKIIKEDLQKEAGQRDKMAQYQMLDAQKMAHFLQKATQVGAELAKGIAAYQAEKPAEGVLSPEQITQYQEAGLTGADINVINEAISRAKTPEEREKIMASFQERYVGATGVAPPTERVLGEAAEEREGQFEIETGTDLWVPHPTSQEATDNPEAARAMYLQQWTELSNRGATPVRVNPVDVGGPTTEQVQLAQMGLVEVFPGQLGTGGPKGDGVDGVLGDLTTTAIQGFQDTIELPVTGQLDTQTLQKLYDLLLGRNNADEYYASIAGTSSGAGDIGALLMEEAL